MASDRDYGAQLLEVTMACAADGVGTRPDLLREPLSALFSTYLRRHGSDAPDASRFGLKPTSLYRTVEVMLRMFYFFSRKKLYSARIARWAEASGRHRDLELLRKVRCVCVCVCTRER